MIELQNISISYQGGIQALSSLSLQIKQGEYVGLLGPNGSGKSTLLKAICGLVGVDSGRITLLGKEVRPGCFGEDLFGRVGVVFQEPEGQFLMRDVRTELALVLENLGLPIQIQGERFEEMIERFGLDAILDQKPEDLSGGQMQMVNLACAMAAEPDLLLLDEPTTFLDSYYKQMLLDNLSALHKRGLTILHITQFPDEAAQAGRICILDHGKLISDCVPDNIWDNEEFIKKHKLLPPEKSSFRKIFGFNWNDCAAAKAFCQNLKTQGKLKEPENANSIDKYDLSVKDLKFSYQNNKFGLSIDKLDFATGEIVGLVGATGSGKSTLAFLLSGLLEPDSGAVAYTGKQLSDYSIKEIRGKIGITWQLPDLAMIGPTVTEEIEFNLEKAVDIVSKLRRVGLEGFEDRIVDTLSGGEKRKLCLAVVLAANPELVILDEPTAFLDPVSQKEFLNIVNGMAQEGRGVIIAGHDLHFISELADRIIGIKNGTIAFDIAAAKFFSDQSYLRALDLPPDPVIGFRQLLAESGHPLPFGSLAPERIWEGLGILEN